MAPSCRRWKSRKRCSCPRHFPRVAHPRLCSNCDFLVEERCSKPFSSVFAPSNTCWRLGALVVSARLHMAHKKHVLLLCALLLCTSLHQLLQNHGFKLCMRHACSWRRERWRACSWLRVGWCSRGGSRFACGGNGGGHGQRLPQGIFRKQLQAHVNRRSAPKHNDGTLGMRAALLRGADLD